MDSIDRESCVTSVACYLNLNDYKYYEGDYSLNDEYKLVAKDNCHTSDSEVIDDESDTEKKIDLVTVEIILVVALVLLSIIYIVGKKKRYF